MDRLTDLEHWVRSHYFGKYRGTVIENHDPLNKGRLQVQVPAVLGTLNVWAMPCVPLAGAAIGLYLTPPTGAGVWVEFEGGDPSFPVWVGCFWADGELPDEADSIAKFLLRTTKSLIKVDDLKGEIVLQSESKASVTLSQNVASAAGQAQHTVGAAGVVSESGAGGKVEVSGPGVKVNSGAFEVI